MTDHDAQFLHRTMALYRRLLKAADLKGGLMSQGDLDVVAAAAMDLMTMAVANMAEPMRSERVKLLSETMAANVAQKRETLEQKISPVKH